VAELRREPVDPVRLVHAVREAMGKEGLRVDISDGIPPRVSLDKRRVGQMLQNLIDNADRYGGGATRLHVSSDERMVRFAVEDSGPGVPDHERSHIFERFARGSTVRDHLPGTGLGLALVAEHAALHGGHVHVEDCAGGGARFVVELPRGDEA